MRSSNGWPAALASGIMRSFGGPVAVSTGSSNVLGIILVIGWIALTGIWIAALIDASKSSPSEFGAAGRSRGGTLALVGLTGWIGGTYYWLAIKREMRSHHQTRDELEQWFRMLDYEVVYDDADGWTWASLRPRSNPSGLRTRYARGRSPDEAVVHAKVRWDVEQTG
jgi:hypothetical protein